ncbi:MAG TPA: RluA family pseudouridine synthase [Oligoflexia bacterium]|nr:RluA family pseudouridine synthase [Oligoflexia bacterium]
MAQTIQLEVPADKSGMRLDTFLSESREELSRSQCQNLIVAGHVSLNGSVITKTGSKVSIGDLIRVDVPTKTKLDLSPVDLSLEVVFEDNDLAVINKPAGLSVHPSPTENGPTMVHGLLHQLSNLSGVGGVERPGIVHRIDKGTSGILVVSKNDRAHEILAKYFHDHTIERTYTTLVFGDLSSKGGEGTIASDFGRHPNDRKKMTGKFIGKKSGKTRRAITHWKVQTVFRVGNRPLSLVECKLETGRTHQIRVHLSEFGFPVVGDPVYGDHQRRAADLSKIASDVGGVLNPLSHQLLHARTLGFKHPIHGTPLHFEAPLPNTFKNVLSVLEKYAV